MNFLENIDRVRHSRQYKKKFDALMWLSRYKRCNHGQGINVKELCTKCNISNHEYECVMAGSPLASIPDCNKVVKYMRSAYYNSVNKSVFWISKSTYQVKEVPHNSNNTHNTVRDTSDMNKYFLDTWNSNNFNNEDEFRSPSHTKPLQVFKSES